jgi:hypothetical protein
VTLRSLITSILIACVLSQAVGLVVAGLASTVMEGKIDGLFALAALPMTLVFFGLPALIWSLIVIIPTFYAFSWYERVALTPFAVFAVGAAILLWLFVTDPPPTGAMPGYDQAAQLFVAIALVGWALYARFHLNLGRT